LRKLEFVKADKQTSRYKPLHAPIIPETTKDPRLINALHHKPIAPHRPPLLLGCAIHNPSLYYLATLAVREKRTEPTQENITLCYESRASTPALQGFHVVIRAPGVLPLAGRHRARAVPRKRPARHRHPRFCWYCHSVGKAERLIFLTLWQT
jgi:hypothetical protein